MHTLNVVCHIQCNGLSSCHWWLKWKVEWRPKSCRLHVQTNGARTAGQLSHNASCDGYLAPAAAAKATSNGPHFRQDLFRIGLSTTMRLRLSHERGLHNSQKYAKPLNSPVKSCGVAVYCVCVYDEYIDLCRKGVPERHWCTGWRAAVISALSS